MQIFQTSKVLKFFGNEVSYEVSRNRALKRFAQFFVQPAANGLDLFRCQGLELLNF